MPNSHQRSPEMMDAWERYKESRDEEALALLLKSYTPLVHRLSRNVSRKKPANMDEDDLFQSGMIGLMDAIERFDHTKGILFSTFARQRILGSIYDDINMLDWTPRLVRDRIKLVLKTEEVLRRQGQPSPTAEEISVAAKEHFEKDITPPQVSEAQAQAQKTYVHAIDNSTVIEHEESTSPGFVNSNSARGVEETIFITEIRDILIEIISTECTALEATIIQETLINEKSLKETAKIQGISAARASMTRREALNKLRRSLRERGIDSPLEWLNL